MESNMSFSSSHDTSMDWVTVDPNPVEPVDEVDMGRLKCQYGNVAESSLKAFLDAGVSINSLVLSPTTTKFDPAKVTVSGWEEFCNGSLQNEEETGTGGPQKILEFVGGAEMYRVPAGEVNVDSEPDTAQTPEVASNASESLDDCLDLDPSCTHHVAADGDENDDDDFFDAINKSLSPYQKVADDAGGSIHPPSPAVSFISDEEEKGSQEGRLNDLILVLEADSMMDCAVLSGRDDANNKKPDGHDSFNINEVLRHFKKAKRQEEVLGLLAVYK